VPLSGIQQSLALVASVVVCGVSWWWLLLVWSVVAETAASSRGSMGKIQKTVQNCMPGPFRQAT
jgi:hypothetical protein